MEPFMQYKYEVLAESSFLSKNHFFVYLNMKELWPRSRSSALYKEHRAYNASIVKGAIWCMA